MAASTDRPLIVVVGPTASGKSSLALYVAERYNGEIIAADSRTIYQGMDIGTAKPTSQERCRAPHHLLDICKPDQVFSAAEYQKLAREAIKDISSRGKIPVMVGGTGLYVDSIVYNFSFRGHGDAGLRKDLERLSVAELQSRLLQEGLELPNNQANPRHLIRAIETRGATSRKEETRANTIILGVQHDKESLERRVEQRVDNMLVLGLEDEARRLADHYGWGCQALQSIGYQEFRPYFDGLASVQEVRRLIIRHTMQYAKRQKTWFRRNQSIHWISDFEEANDILTTFLDKRTVVLNSNLLQ